MPGHSFSLPWLRYLIPAAVLFWLVMTMTFAMRAGVVTDEVPHLGDGMCMWLKGDRRLNPEHPPLVKALAALPVMLFARPDAREAFVGPDGKPSVFWVRADPWPTFYYLVFLDESTSWRTRLMLARMAPILIGLLGGLLAFVWGREWSGRATGGACAAVLLMFYPEYSGHSAFVAFDVPLLTACAAVSWFAWRWWRSPSMRNAALLAFVGAVASQVKLPASVFVFLVTVALGLLIPTSAGRVRWSSWLGLVLMCVAGGFVAAWAGAGFRFSCIAPGELLEGQARFVPPYPAEGAGIVLRFCNWAWEHRLLPETSLATLALGAFGDREYYLFGTDSKTGWYHYFLVTYFLKSTLPLLAAPVLLAFMALRTVREKKSRTRAWRFQRGCILGLPFCLLALMVVVSRVNIGHRHILFVYFPLCVVAGAELGRWLSRSTRWGWAAGAILGLQVLSYAWAFPNLSTYFNIFGGSPYRASQWIGDSNTDWGQDDIAIPIELDRLGATAMNLAPYVAIPLEVHGAKDYRWIDPMQKPPFTHMKSDPPDPSLPTFISVNTLRRMRKMYPALYRREPDEVLNSHVVFLPVEK